VQDNKVNGKPLVYLEDVSDYKVEDAGQVILLNCNNITVENLDLSRTSVGIELCMTEDSKMLNNTVSSNNRDGIYLSYSSNNSIIGNNVCNNLVGIYLPYSSNNEGGIGLFYSSNNSVTGNNVCNNNRYGIGLSDSRNNRITGNNVSSNNNDGISLSYSSNNNTFIGNNVSSNNNDGISLSHSSNNNIHLNNFIGKSRYVRSYKSTNIWNSPLEMTYTYDGTAYTSYLGNYWDDYEGTDTDGDGIGNTPFSIDSESDDYPLIKPFENYII
jgi:parallel beta-helix repeat protein